MATLFEIGKKKRRRITADDLCGAPSTNDGREWVKPHQWSILYPRVGQTVLVAWHDGWKAGVLEQVTIDDIGSDSVAVVTMPIGEIVIDSLFAIRVEKGNDPRYICPECEGRKSANAKMCAKCWARHPDNSWAR